MVTLATSLHDIQRLFWRLVPETLFHPGFFLSGPQEFYVSMLPLDGASRLRLQDIAKAGGAIAIKLDPTLALKRVISLPRAAVSHADKAIGLQIRQTMPAQAAGLVWRSSMSKARGALVDYDVYVLKGDQIADLTQIITASGGRLHSIGLKGVGGDPYATGRAFAASWRNRWMTTSVLAVIIGGLFQVFSIEGQISAIEHSNEQRVNRLAETEAALIQAKQQAGKVEGEKLLIQEDFDLFRRQSVPLEILADMTEVLPDTVWVSELSLGGDQLALSGFTSGDVAEVIEEAQSLTWANQVVLQGPALIDSYSNQIRFDLAIEMNVKVLAQ